MNNRCGTSKLCRNYYSNNCNNKFFKSWSISMMVLAILQLYSMR